MAGRETKPKKEASTQAKGRAKKAKSEGFATRDAMINALTMNNYKAAGIEADGRVAPATYGNKPNKKLKPLAKLQNKKYGAYGSPANALAMNRSAKAKDSKPKGK